MQQTDPESAVSRQSWEWLLDLAARLDIIIEMVDEHQAPVFPVGSTPDAAEFRTLLASGEPTIQSAMSDVLASRKPVFVSVETVQAVSCALASGGVLFVGRGLALGDSVEECRQDLESIALWLAGAIDATLAQTSAISVEPYRIASFRRILREATSRGSARKVIGAFVEALSVWDDVRARCYVAGANGGFLAYGASLAAPPSTHDYLDDAVAPAHGRIVRLSRIEIEDVGLISEPGDSLMLRILAGNVAWLLLFSGMIDDREQVRLKGVLRHPSRIAERRGHNGHEPACGGSIEAAAAGERTARDLRPDRSRAVDGCRWRHARRAGIDRQRQTGVDGGIDRAALTFR